MDRLKEVYEKIGLLKYEKYLLEKDLTPEEIDECKLDAFIEFQISLKERYDNLTMDAFVDSIRDLINLKQE